MHGESRVPHGEQSGPGVSRRYLRRAQAGDRYALNELFRRELPPLRRWARSRVPKTLWPRADVDDLVQLTFIRALRRYCDFEMRTSAEFQHYLRRILLNLTRDEVRSAKRAPESIELGDIAWHRAPSSLDVLLGQEATRRFHLAVDTLPQRSRTALLARLERGLPYDDIAVLIAAPGASAARAVVARSVQRVANSMQIARHGTRARKKAR